MDVRWITVFIDRPAADFDTTVGFWCTASGSSTSSWRGDEGEFATLVPDDGADAHLRVQRTASEHAGSHIDLHVADVRAGADEAVAAGASVLTDHGGYVVLASPGGMPFCVVAHDSEQQRQAPVPTGTTTTLVDQVCIDVDPDRFDAEVAFWSTVTGWPRQGAKLAEFVPLERPPAMPVRLLLQRRDSPTGSTTCHLDLACGDVVSAVTAHEALGAGVVAPFRYWTVMADPSGTEYCLTSRDPTTGVIGHTG